MKLSDNLRSIRKENNLSQEQLAEKLGVSRQAVSKWESGQSYPEMDKVLLICKLFNYNIDELMNENVKEVDETKQSKININKYIDDFFAFITKTVDMLSCMKFRQKLKFFIEQVVVSIFLLIVFLIIGTIASSVVLGVFGRFSTNIYYIIRDILRSIYIVFALVVGVTILLHIFKIRYLDYYEIVKEDNEKEKSEQDNKKIEETENDEEKNKIFIEKKKEKIIIRDPNHSQSKFLTGIFKIILWFIKFMTICIGIGFVFTFVGLVTLLILSFMFVKTGLVFGGSLFAIVAALIINFIILEILYNFIVNRKSKKTRMWISFIVSLLLAGIGIGMILIGITQFNYIEDADVNNQIEEVYEYKMTDDLSINAYSNYIKYVEQDIKNVKIVVKHSKYLKPHVSNEDDIIEVYCHQDDTKTMEVIRDTIKDINNKEIKNKSTYTIYIYASKDNIEKIQQNKVEKMEEQILELENELEEKESIIESLQDQIVIE